MIVLITIGILWLCLGVYSAIFYIREFAIPETKENKFDWQMIIVALTALLLPPVYWFLRYVAKNVKII